MGVSGLTVAEALDELDRLATVEHALMVEYLSIYYALMPPMDAAGPAAASGPASEAALTLAKAEMRHLHVANGTLTRAGRPAQIGRAASIDLAGSPTAVGLPTAAQLGHVVDREKAIASAVDARYAPVCVALADEDPFFDCPDHLGALAELETRLAGLDAAAYLHTTRREPHDQIEREALAVSDQYYGLIVSSVAASFAHEAELHDLLNRAKDAMDLFDSVNQLLVRRGLLPAFTL